MVIQATDLRADRADARMRNSAALRAWAAKFGKGATTYLSKRTGLTFAAVARVLKGKAQSTPHTAALFEAATDGAVTAAELLGLGTALTVTTNGAHASGDLANRGAA